MLSIGQLPETDLPQNRNEAELKHFVRVEIFISPVSDNGISLSLFIKVKKKSIIIDF